MREPPNGLAEPSTGNKARIDYECLFNAVPASYSQPYDRRNEETFKVRSSQDPRNHGTVFSLFIPYDNPTAAT